ncbi:MAG: ArgR family transcriptional regulator [Spirochaetales bacterium]|nr:ArgR family transcriptional regulator [Spirochaetales bacterium]
MNGRDARLKSIRSIIAEERISSQDQLLQKLGDMGVTITQATLSRDLKVLKVAKVPDVGGGYHYALSENEGESLKGYIEDFKRGYLSISFSRNLCVIRTLAGHANSVAIALDRLAFPEILGTIAGDDTILLIIREDITQADVLSRLESLVGELETE